MKFSRLNESLDWISQGDSREIRLVRAKAIADSDATFIQYMQLATDPSKKIGGLPKGEPSIYRPKHDMPDGVSDTVLRTELRRVSNFLPNGNIKNLPETKRVALWTNILEGLHWKEALILTYIKDQNLLEIYPKMEEILSDLGVTLINSTTTEAPINSTTTEAPGVTETKTDITTTKKPRKNAKIKENIPVV